MSSSSWLFSSTKRIVGRVAASHDPLGVAIVVLLRLDVGPDVFRRHQPDVMAADREQPPQRMGPAAGLHPDNERKKLLRQSNQRLSPYLATHNDRAGRMQPNHAADVLAEVHAKHRDIHPFLLLIPRRALRRRKEGRAIPYNFPRALKAISKDCRRRRRSKFGLRCYAAGASARLESPTSGTGGLAGGRMFAIRSSISLSN